MQLTLTPIQDSDIELLSEWLHKDYILQWYHDADEWIHEIKEREGSFNFLSHYIILENNKPIGFCQFYDCFDAKEDWYSVECPNKIYSIDYLIGEENFLRKGYGKEIIRILTNKIIRDKNPKAIIVQPEQENIASCKALLANGYIYDLDNNYYILECL